MSDVKSRKFLLRLVLLVVIPAAAIVTGGYFYLIGGRYISTENAYVKADIIQVSAVLDGQVTEVAIGDHIRVHQGDLLFRLDPKPFELAVAKAEAELDSVRTRIETLRAAYYEAKSEMGEIEANIAYLERLVPVSACSIVIRSSGTPSCANAALPAGNTWTGHSPTCWLP